MTTLRYLSDVATLKLDVDKCIGCGRCIEVCPHAVFVLEGKKACILDCDACMECGAWARNCPVQALAVQAGVGCATGIIIGAIRGTGPTCGCSDDDWGCCGSSGCCG